MCIAGNLALVDHGTDMSLAEFISSAINHLELLSLKHGIILKFGVWYTQRSFPQYAWSLNEKYRASGDFLPVTMLKPLELVFWYEGNLSLCPFFHHNAYTDDTYSRRRYF